MPTRSPASSSSQPSRSRGILGLHGPPAGAVVAVAARDVGGCDLGELVDHREVVDVPGVEDAVDAAEGLEDLRPELRHRLRNVRVRDQPDAQRGRAREPFEGFEFAHARPQAPRRWLSTTRAASAGCSSTSMWPAPGSTSAVASGNSAR